jgi:vacuolar-type H+-ATPase subunit H
MNAPTSSAATEKAPPVHLDVEAEISKLAEESIPKRSPQIESEVERIRSSITRLTSSSIDGLEGLTSELQDLQRFLNSEVQRVQSEIESALAGIKIIIETIAPCKRGGGALSPPASARAPRLGLGSKY